MFNSLSPEQAAWVNDLSDEDVIAVHDLTHRIMMARLGTSNRAIPAEAQLTDQSARIVELETEVRRLEIENEVLRPPEKGKMACISCGKSEIVPLPKSLPDQITLCGSFTCKQCVKDYGGAP